MNHQCEVIIVAGGQGQRMKADQPKAFLTIENKPILAYAIERFAQVEAVTKIIIVVPQGWEEAGMSIARNVGGHQKVSAIIAGGARRQDSVRAGLDQLDPNTEIVLIHDAARIFTSSLLIEKIIRATIDYQAAIPGIAVVDTLKRINENQEVISTIERRQLVAIQTPQGFNRQLLEKAYQQAWANNTTATDDAGLIEALGYGAKVVEGEAFNYKLTTSDDLLLAKTLINSEGFK